MMTPRKLFFATAIVVLSFGLVVQVTSQPTDTIIVNNADEIREESVSVTQDLLDSVGGVATRILLENANELRHFPLAIVPGELDTFLDQVADRVVVDEANEIRHEDLPALPGGLNTFLGQVIDRIIFETANANRQEGLNYPFELIADDAPPIFSELQVNRVSNEAVIISWTTNEFTDSVFRYGSQPGNYTWTITNPEFLRQHSVQLSGLVPETVYYYRIRGTDLSGNTAQTGERSFEFEELYFLFLPAITGN